jgi:hypothetical protein
MLDGRDALTLALSTLGELLGERGHAYDLVLIGGGALMLSGLIERPTKDLDVLARMELDNLLPAEPLPEPLQVAVRDVAEVLDLDPGWLNGGPTALLDQPLPSGFQERLETRTFGALTVRIASRVDQVAFKLFAAVDQGPHSKHVSDLRKLAPTSAELVAAARWCRTHDPSEGFRETLVEALRAFGVDDYA